MIKLSATEKETIFKLVKRYGRDNNVDILSFVVKEDEGIVYPAKGMGIPEEMDNKDFTDIEKTTILKYAKLSGCDRDGDMISFVIKKDNELVYPTRDIIDNTKLSTGKNNFIDIPIDIPTLESIARVSGCHYKNFDWWEVSQFIKERCIEYENMNLRRKK